MEDYAEQRQLLQTKADFDALNDLRKAMYESELKSITVLQSLNGGGLTLLVTFLAKSGLSSEHIIKIFFLSSIVCFIMGFLSSMMIMINYPDFLENRYKNEGIPRIKRSKWLFGSIGFFILSIILIIAGLLI